jgi:hypothetical protein
MTSTKTASPYTDIIRATAAAIGRLGYSPRLIEAWMRLEHDTLDGLTHARFKAEVEAACKCIDADPQGSETLAASYGL